MDRAKALELKKILKCNMSNDCIEYKLFMALIDDKIYESSLGNPKTIKMPEMPVVDFKNYSREPLVSICATDEKYKELEGKYQELTELYQIRVDENESLKKSLESKNICDLIEKAKRYDIIKWYHVDYYNFGINGKNLNKAEIFERFLKDAKELYDNENV